jgi:hypothetical protein
MMLTVLDIIPATDAHIEAIVPNLRVADRCEIEVAGLNPLTALMQSHRMALVSRCAVLGGEVIATWGMGGTPLGDVGLLWLMTTPKIETIRKTFVRETHNEVAMMLAICPELRGMVDARYARAVRFLDVLGFDLGPEFAFGPDGAAFRWYCKRRG